MLSLQVLREQNEDVRFERLRRDDAPPAVDAQALEAELRKSITGEVRFDAGSRALYSTDGSNYRQVPIGVVIPRSAEDVVKTIDLARQFPVRDDERRGADRRQEERGGHHRSIMGLDDEKQLLGKMGLDCHVLSDTCCGMAGSFGFETGHYGISMQIGERELLPAVRNAPKDELIVANGFSCIEQVRQGSDRRPLHLAQISQMALHDGPKGPSGAYPEVHYPVSGSQQAPGLTVGTALLAGTAAVGGLLLWRWAVRRSHSRRLAQECNAEETLHF
jgi:hypothetical protein